jgi:hypothetical protein
MTTLPPLRATTWWPGLHPAQLVTPWPTPQNPPPPPPESVYPATDLFPSTGLHPHKGVSHMSYTLGRARPPIAVIKPLTT